MKGMGYILGVIIGVPLVILVVNFLFFSGNSISPQHIDRYINDSKAINVFIPPATRYYSETYYPKLTRSNNVKAIFRLPFYSQSYHKYLVLITFNGFDFSDSQKHDKNNLRMRMLYSGGYFSVRANSTQWNDPSYGTEANPIPVFGIEVTGKENKEASISALNQSKAEFDVPASVNKIFVEQYLNYFLTKKDADLLFAGEE